MSEVYHNMNGDVPLAKDEIDYANQIMFLECDIKNAHDGLISIIKDMKTLIKKVDAAIVGWQKELNPIEEKRSHLLKNISLANEAKTRN